MNFLKLFRRTTFFTFQRQVVNTTFVINVEINTQRQQGESEITFEILVTLFNGMDKPRVLWQGYQKQEDRDREFIKLVKLLGI